MCRQKSLRKHVQLVLAINPNQITYPVDINVEFEPDDLVVNHFSFDDTASVVGTVQVSSNLVPMTGPMFALAFNLGLNVVTQNQLGYIYPLQNRVNGQYNFNFADAAGLPPNWDGFLTLHLEFIKYLD